MESMYWFILVFLNIILTQCKFGQSNSWPESPPSPEGPSQGRGQGSHPCLRECSANPNSRMTCGYKFTVAHSFVLSRYCNNCPNNTEDCSRRGCVPADGFPRTIAIVNDLMPGPAIRVCEGDTIVVDVMNTLIAEETAIHWHGIDQKGTPWMDGVPSLTQCAIPHGNTFRCSFEASLAGTYFWHSHEDLQRSNGYAGMLVIRPPPARNAHRDNYDFDLPEHEILVWDWYEIYELEAYLREAIVNRPRPLPSNILVNGRGFPSNFFSDFTTKDTIEGKGRPFVPIPEFRIKRGKRYRFRVVSNGIQACPIEVSVENHQLYVIGTDAMDIQPRKVSSFLINAGERYDFVLTGNQPAGSYWIKFRGFLDCQANDLYQLAVLNYESIPMGTFPKQTIRTWEDAGPNVPGQQLNPIDVPSTAAEAEAVITIPELRTVTDEDPEIVEQREPDYRFPLLLQLARHFDPPECPSGQDQCSGPPVETTGGETAFFSFRVNKISNILPVPPPLIHPETNGNIKKCNLRSNRASNIDCSRQECICSHWLQVRLNSIVEVVLINDPTVGAAHPFHLHGHAFRVISTKTSEITDITRTRTRSKGVTPDPRDIGAKNAIVKDTVWVPAASQVTIRFRADNPGYWFFHCHLDIHSAEGMSLVFQVGDVRQIPRPPPDFPRCGNYTPPERNIRWG